MRGSYRFYQYQSFTAVSGVQFSDKQREGSLKTYVFFPKKADFLAHLNSVYNQFDTEVVAAALELSGVAFSATQPYPNKSVPQ